MPMTLDDDDCYQLFLSLDTMARLQGGQNELVNSQRERFLPFYRGWHAAHPHEVHPTLRGALIAPSPVRDGGRSAAFISDLRK